jgi:hypothetical protein
MRGIQVSQIGSKDIFGSEDRQSQDGEYEDYGACAWL